MPPEDPPKYCFAFPGFHCPKPKCNKWGGRIRHINDNYFVCRCDHCGRKSIIQIKYLEVAAMNDYLKTFLVRDEW